MPAFEKDSALITPQGFMPDIKTFYYSTNNLKEAYFLVVILNSNILDGKIKTIQTKGKWGPRDIHRRPAADKF